jgi:hypothetical protein
VHSTKKNSAILADPVRCHSAGSSTEGPIDPGPQRRQGGLWEANGDQILVVEFRLSRTEMTDELGEAHRRRVRVVASEPETMWHAGALGRQGREAVA